MQEYENKDAIYQKYFDPNTYLGDNNILHRIYIVYLRIEIPF